MINQPNVDNTTFPPGFISEARLQENCYVWFHNTYPHLRGLLFRIKNEGTNKISGARDKALGVVPGVSDMCLILEQGKACFIEFKSLTGKLSDKQKTWSKIVIERGCLYVEIRTETEFKELCHQLVL